MKKAEYSVRQLVNMGGSGELRLPEMQRGYVWRATRVRDLMNSLYWGYPSGVIFAWKTDRILGVPTIADRDTLTVVAARLEKSVEPIFHPDFYGYRSRRSALDAVAVCRRRCGKKDWVVDLDVQSSSTACRGI